MLTFNEIKTYSEKFYPVVLLDQFMKYSIRVKMRKLLSIILGFVFLIMILAPYTNTGILSVILPIEVADFLFLNLYKIRGLFFIVFVIWINGYLYEAFYLSHYLKKTRVEYEVAQLVYNSHESDLTAGFLKSEIGKYVMMRLGITENRIKQFIKDDAREKIKQQEILVSYNGLRSPNDDTRVINLHDYVKSIYDKDLDLQYFLQKSNLTHDDFFGCVKWAQNISYKIKASERFFTRERLIRIKTIGRNWHTKDIDYLHKYCHLIYENKFYQSLGKDWHFFRDEAEEMENLLIDQKNENILLITERISTGMQIVATFGKMITNGLCVYKFESKKLFVLNADILLINNSDANSFEMEFRRIVEQATNTRDIILVISNLPKIVRMGNKLNLDIIEMLQDVLRSTDLPFITVSSRNDFHETIEPHQKFNQQFDRYTIPEIDREFLIKILENEAMKIERYDKILITYPPLKDIADKYIDQEDAIKKALVELHKIYQS